VVSITIETSAKHLSRTLILCGLLCAGLLGFSTAPASAAPVPCWKKLLNDWYDGKIDKIYPLPCYHEAIKHLPADVEVYSSAKDDILNALAAAAKKKPAPAEKTTTSGTTTRSVTTTPTTTKTSTRTSAATTTKTTKTKTTKTKTKTKTTLGERPPDASGLYLSRSHEEGSR
jgi:hypothetical protein